MGTVRKWLPLLIIVSPMGLVGNIAVAGTGQPMVRVACYDLDYANPEVHGNWSPSFAQIDVENNYAFAAGPKANAQGIYRVGELAAKPFACDIDGKRFEFRVKNYSVTELACAEWQFVNYQLEAWYDGDLLYRTALAKEPNCEISDAETFVGSIRINSGGYTDVCGWSLMGIGTPSEPKMGGNETYEDVMAQMKREHEAWVNSDEPSKPGGMVQYLVEC
jgi:hypothetical protein